MRENKAEFCNKLCELLQMTSNLGHPDGNPIKELRYIKDGYDEYVRPIFANGNGESGYYDVNVSADNCMGILADVFNNFIRRY